jgi:predicted thioesterase
VKGPIDIGQARRCHARVFCHLSLIQEKTHMKEGLCPGVSRTNTLVVDHTRSIDFMGEEGRVYSTPNLVRDIEVTCRELLLDYCDANEDSVGTEICIKHLAPTLIDMKVAITATVATVDGRRVSFDISARDDAEQICSGTHGRFVTDVGKTIDRLKKKSASLQRGGEGDHAQTHGA